MTALGALPLIPGAACPSVASALGAAGLGTVCKAVTGGAGAAGVAGSAASQLAGFGVNSVLNALGSWVSAGASWLLTQIGRVIGTTTGVDLGASWFTVHYETMAALAGVVIVPMLLLGIMQSIYRQNASMLIRSVVVNVPLAILLTAVAVKLVQLGLSVTDAMSVAVAHGAGLDSGHFLSTVTVGLSGTAADGQPGAPTFVVFLGGLAIVVGALMVWIELLIRAAAVYVAVLFLPLALASLAWPAIAHWSRRLVDTLVALILGKFVIVSVLSLAAGALAGGTGSVPSGSAASGTSAASAGGGFTAVLGGAALLLFASLAPWALFRLLPFLEAGAAGHLEGLSHRTRQGAGTPAKSLVNSAMKGMAASAVLGGAAGGSAGKLLSGLGQPGSMGHGGGAQGGTTGGGQGDSRAPTDPSTGQPNLGPTSAESTGVGSMESASDAVPGWEPNSKATATAGALGLTSSPSQDGDGQRSTSGPTPGSESPPLAPKPPSPSNTVLPTGAVKASEPGGIRTRHPGDPAALPPPSGDVRDS